MKPCIVKPVEKLTGKVSLPGDKSIAHRAVILSALSKGKVRIKNFPSNDDCLATISVFKKLGIKILKGKTTVVYGKGLFGLKPAGGPILIKESGTTMRLLTGVLAGQPFKSVLLAGENLSRRPMHRVVLPLKKMGALISARASRTEDYPPLTIEGGRLKAITYKMTVASAQVKSAILLAGLYARGKTCVIETVKTRDHTERMLKVFGAQIESGSIKITVKGNRELAAPSEVYIPADISSAAFFIAAATILPGSKITVNKASLNYSRTGIIRVLKRMGANIETPEAAHLKAGEPVGNITVKSSRLKGVIISREEVPSLIDELPVLMVVACFARGVTEFQGVEELRVKETDRINSMTLNLKKMGADIKVVKIGQSEKIVIKGVKGLTGARVNSFCDHRTAMSLVVAGLAAQGRTEIDDISCISKSFPGFIRILNSLKPKA